MPKWLRLSLRQANTGSDLGRDRDSEKNLWDDESGQGAAEECVSLVSIPIPLPILVANDLCRHDNAEGAEIVLLDDPVISDLIVRTEREFRCARELSVLQHFDFVFTRVLIHLVVKTGGHNCWFFIPEDRFF